MGILKNIINTAVSTAKEVTAVTPSLSLSEYLISKTSIAVSDYLNKEEIEEAELKGIINKYFDFFNSENYNQALKVLDDLFERYNEDIYLCWFYYTEKADTLIAYGRSQFVAEYGEPEYEEQRSTRDECNRKAKIALDKADEYEDSLSERCRILFLRSFCQNEPDKGGGRKYLIGALATDNDKEKDDYLSAYLNSTNNMEHLRFEEYRDEKIWNDPTLSEEDRKDMIGLLESEKFTNINYVNRQLIFVGRDDDHIAGCYDSSNNINWVFTLSYVPSDIKFPVGHPQANTLYIAHPVNKEIYIPFEGSAYNFFIDKVHELCHLLQCLGATEISFKSIKGRETIMEVNGNWGIGGEIGATKYGKANGQYSQTNGYNSYQSKSNEMGLVMTANPKEYPFCPDDLKWLETDTQWKNLVRQRLSGNLLSFKQTISTKSVSNISNSQKIEIKGAFENFMARVSANYESETDSTFKETEETEWEITAKFKPLEDYDNVDEKKITTQQTEELTEESANIDTAILTDDEQSYAEEVKFCLEDGTIGDKERRFLERMRTKFGISPERAAEIEETLQKPQFTEEEQEYLDAVKEEIVDGTIPESSRRLLNRLRRSMDISEDRAEEIEKYAISLIA